MATTTTTTATTSPRTSERLRRRSARASLAFALSVALVATACGAQVNDDGLDVVPRRPPLERVAPDVDTSAVRVVSAIDIADVIATVAASVGLSENAARAFLEIDGTSRIGPIDVANAVIDGVGCLEEQGKLHYAFYQDREHPESVGVFFALDLAAVARVDSLICAFETLVGALLAGTGGLPDPLPDAPVLDPCFEEHFTGGVQVVYVASTDWMCDAFAGSPPTVPCANGSHVHPRDACPTVDVSIASTRHSASAVQYLITGFDLRHRGMRWEFADDPRIFCSGDLDVLVAHRPLSEQELERCRSNGVEIASIRFGDEHTVHLVARAVPQTVASYLRSDDSSSDYLAQAFVAWDE